MHKLFDKLLELLLLKEEKKCTGLEWFSRTMYIGNVLMFLTWLVYIYRSLELLLFLQVSSKLSAKFSKKFFGYLRVLIINIGDKNSKKSAS